MTVFLLKLELELPFFFLIVIILIPLGSAPAKQGPGAKGKKVVFYNIETQEILTFISGPMGAYAREGGRLKNEN